MDLLENICQRILDAWISLLVLDTRGLLQYSITILLHFLFVFDFALLALGAVCRIGIDDLAGEGAVHDDHRVQYKSRSNLRQFLFLGVVCIICCGWRDLIMTDPDLLIEPEEAHDMIVERLALWMIPRDAEDL